MTKLLSSIALAALASACVSGLATTDIPPAGMGAFVSGDSAAYDTAAATPDQWWKLYADPRLDALVEQALHANTDLRAAEANLRAVRASLGESRIRAYLPSTSLSATTQRGRVPANTVPGATSQLPITETYSAGIDVSFELDLFGRQRHSTGAAYADFGAATAARDVVRVTIAAETARAFADTCSANAQLAVAQRTLDVQQRASDLTKRLLEAGSGNGLDAARASAALESTRAAVPAYAAQRDAALFRLATLIAVPPAEAPQEARECATPPTLTSPLPIGDGKGMLARRPDIRQAARALKASAERVGVSIADLLPTISLGGSGTVVGPNTQDLDRPVARGFSVGPLLTWSFPNVFAAHMRIEQASARNAQALANWDGAVLGALQETETALSSYANELDANEALGRARDQSAEAARLANLRFEAGRDSFLSLLDAQRTQAQADAAYAASNAALVSKQITLFKALGGGWEQAPPVNRE